MTLVVARRFKTEIRIVSDTHAPDAFGKLHLSDLDRSCLKCILLSPSCCVAFAGPVTLAKAAIAPILRLGGAERRHVVDHLLEQHRRSNQLTDYLVAFAGPRPDLCLNSKGSLKADQPAAWIGDEPAFAEFQASFGREAEPACREDAWTGWVGRMNEAMKSVINDARHSGVGGLVVTVTSNPSQRDGFRYLSLEQAQGFHTAPLSTTSTNVVRPLGAAGGGFTQKLLVPTTAGVGAVAMHIPEGPTGALFYPARGWEAFRYPQLGVEEFISRVASDHGIVLGVPLQFGLEASWTPHA